MDVRNFPDEKLIINELWPYLTLVSGTKSIIIEKESILQRICLRRVTWHLIIHTWCTCMFIGQSYFSVQFNCIPSTWLSEDIFYRYVRKFDTLFIYYILLVVPSSTITFLQQECTINCVIIPDQAPLSRVCMLSKWPGYYRLSCFSLPPYLTTAIHW